MNICYVQFERFYKYKQYTFELICWWFSIYIIIDYRLATSDGSKEGLDQQQGGSCVRYNMKTQIRVNNKKEDLYEGDY